MLEHLDIRNLATTNYCFVRRFIELMPLETLYLARQSNADLRMFSEFRGEFRATLLVDRNHLDYESVTYSDMINRPHKLTPVYNLSVHMGPHINPEALIAKMVKQVYRTLYIYGDYHWRQILDFFHTDLRCVKLYGNMEMPRNEMTDFFTTLLGRLIPWVIILNENSDGTWIHYARQVWSDWEHASSFHAHDGQHYYRLTVTGKDDVTRRLNIRNWVPQPGDPEEYEKTDAEDNVVE
uniref:FBA_2 domain-containing protein n=1 Tax=Panagrellus redivivus TaxID=6233 RepID=A0A7E4UM72_PANRE